MTPAYYNEHDPFAAAWLRELIADGLIAPGQVDERDIQDVQSDDLRGFRQCHFFAGIGGWSLALRLAGVPDDRSLWTGSCPCQPFSAAGAQAGTADPRHLWPHWFRLIRECKPPLVLGEQVASAIAHGWYDLVADDLESCDYALGALVAPAASVGAWHQRERLWFVAESIGARAGRDTGTAPRAKAGMGGTGQSDGDHGGIAPQSRGAVDLVADRRLGTDGRASGDTGHGDECRTDDGMGDGERTGLQGFTGDGRDGDEPGRQPARAPRSAAAASLPDWSAITWHLCRDGKRRPVPLESEIFPLAARVPNRVGALRGAGNAIVPQVAAEFIHAYLDIEQEGA